ncbi:MAG: hypothetical protein WEA84_14765 [Rhodovibrionaceae bacterium]
MTRETEKDRELWQRAAAAWGEESAAEHDLDPLLLAAYLDGTLDEQETAALEARLAAEPELLETWLSAHAVLSETPEAAPQSVISRAQDIVGAPGRADRAGRSWLAGWLQPLGWAAVCALALVVTGAGFEIGREGYDAVVEVQSLMSETLAFDFSDPASDLLL